MTNKTFIKITNQQIYDEIQCIKKEITKLNIKTSVNAAVVAVIVSVVVGIVVRFA